MARVSCGVGPMCRGMKLVAAVYVVATLVSSA
jgi:hypothetical protein